MNAYLIQKLVLKDWYLQRIPILLSLAGVAISMALMLFGHDAGFMIGLIALISILIGFGANLSIATIVNERKEQTLPFVMSLPISHREYTTAKILSGVLLFLVPWLAIALSTGALFLVAPTTGPSSLPHGLIPYWAIMIVEIGVSTCLIACVALATESQPWTISAVMVCNIGFNVFGYIVAHTHGISRTMYTPTLQWPPMATVVLLAEVAAILLMLSLTFVIQARKKDFL